jgi:AcrR family transcriptional regulator
VSEFAFATGAPSPRKRPVQDRSRETVAAIVAATFQVLDDDGEALTTTRVAAVAGVSVGTLYQYFPHRDALINGALAEHLEAAIGAVEAAAAEAEALALPPALAAEQIVRAFLAVKADRAPISRILNRAFGVGKLDDRPVVRAASQRAQRAIVRALAAGRAHDPVLAQRAEIACAALEGVVRAAVDDDPERLRDPRWIEQVVQVAVGALADERSAR